MHWAVDRQNGTSVHSLGCGPPEPHFRPGSGLWAAKKVLPFTHWTADRQSRLSVQALGCGPPGGYFPSGIRLRADRSTSVRALRFLATKTVHPFTHCVVERQNICNQVLVCGRPSWIVRAGAGLCTARMVLPCSHWAVDRQSGASIQALGCGMPEWWLRPIVGSWPAS